MCEVPCYPGLNPAHSAEFGLYMKDTLLAGKVFKQTTNTYTKKGLLK